LGGDDKASCLIFFHCCFLYGPIKEGKKRAFSGLPAAGPNPVFQRFQ
jgi:hypothetical protein